MKAASPILVQTQRPLTILGVAPVLFALSAGAGGAAMGLMVPLGLAAVSLPVGVGVTAVLMVRSWRRTRQDHHYDRQLLRAPRFWQGKRLRGLVAGGTA